jgi:ATP-dependent exoDNAse (exonuclease V) beta subunit
MAIKKSNDGVCKFYEKSHTYKIKNKKLTSVTTLIHNHFKPFKEREVARKLSKMFWAKRDKKGVRWFLNDWKKSREEGTLCHEEMEIYSKNPTMGRVLLPVFNPRSQEVAKWYDEYMQDKEEYHPEPELLVYDEDYGVAGQVDLPLIKDNKIIIADYKFTKRITKSAFDKEDVGTSEITKHFPNANYYTYTLQLSMYAYLLEKQGFEIEGLVLVHCGPDKKVKTYDLVYEKEVVKSILEDFKNDLEKE